MTRISTLLVLEELANNSTGIVQFAHQPGFMSGRDLRPKHCDLLEQACLQNGDWKTIESIEKARRNWPEHKQVVFTCLVIGYHYHNDAPRIV